MLNVEIGRVHGRDERAVSVPELIEMPKDDRRNPARRELDPSDPVGAALRRLHDDVAAEPLPENFLDLLAEIDRKIAERDRT